MLIGAPAGAAAVADGGADVGTWIEGVKCDRRKRRQGESGHLTVLFGVVIVTRVNEL